MPLKVKNQTSKYQKVSETKKLRLNMFNMIILLRLMKEMMKSLGQERTGVSWELSLRERWTVSTKQAKRDSMLEEQWGVYNGFMIG